MADAVPDGSDPDHSGKGVSIIRRIAQLFWAPADENGRTVPAEGRMSVADWLQQLGNAATVGGMYTLVAVGFTLFFGVMGLINFAHGEVFMIGAFAALVVGSLLMNS